MRNVMLRAIDLCCGVGGWACAARGLPIEFVLAADVAPDCLETWSINHARHHSQCNVTKIDLSQPESVGQIIDACGGGAIDILLGGIPCEEISCARGAIKPARETMERWWRLLDNVLAIVRALKPTHWCIEDVLQIEKHVAPLLVGMSVPYRRIDAAKFGPQRRVRTFLGKPRPAEGRRRVLAECLTPGPHATEPRIDSFERRSAGRNASRVGNVAVRVLDPNAPSWTVMGALDRGSRQRRSFVVETADGRLRVLSWQETALLQGFPEDFIFAAGLSRRQKMIGQAIQIDLGRALLTAMVESSVASVPPVVNS